MRRSASRLSPAERYGRLFAEAARKPGAGRDIIWLGVIDWHFRIQRPQHLAAHLADAGARVFYISIVFEQADQRGRFRIIETPHPGIFEVRLRLAGELSESIYQGLSATAVGELQLALDELIAMLGIAIPVVVVQHPAWHQVACGVAGATVVYDCLDLATGFSNVAKSLGQLETALLASADLVVAASRPLAEHVARQRPAVLIRNAADIEFFGRGFTERLAGERPVIGYFGAIADWFNIEWIEHCAAARPHWEFRLIGRTDGCDISRAAQLPNVTFFGEKPYEELPPFLQQVDVAVIPFKLMELTRCTNPVKLYEYMAAGKPVVAARMPEVVEATDLVYIADDAGSFTDRLDQALAEDSVALRQRRQEWAREHNWANRARQFEQAIEASFPLVSVVILTYNNWDYTSECLASLRRWSDYPNLEVIVVDNASTDGTPEKLRALQRHDDRLQVVLNDSNLGFAAGNNVGLRLARGEYVILSNNDIVFSPRLGARPDPADAARSPHRAGRAADQQYRQRAKGQRGLRHDAADAGMGPPFRPRSAAPHVGDRQPGVFLRRAAAQCDGTGRGARRGLWHRLFRGRRLLPAGRPGRVQAGHRRRRVCAPPPFGVVRHAGIEGQRLDGAQQGAVRRALGALAAASLSRRARLRLRPAVPEKAISRGAAGGDGRRRRGGCRCPRRPAPGRPGSARCG